MNKTGRIFRTPVYKADLRKIYAQSLRRFGEKVADETMRQIHAVEQSALSDSSYGKIDKEHHSKIFRYKTIRNSQTLFFHAIGDDIVMITAGYCSRDWSAILGKMEEEILHIVKNITAKKQEFL